MAEIKIRDLSIGDWVQTVDCDARQNKCCVVEGIEKWRPDYVVVLKYEDGGIETLGRECIEPIPLTPEILEKNGFRKNGEYNEWNIGEWNERPFIGISLDRQSMRVKHLGSDIFVENKVVCVHQLQHALRLAGVEKEIEV